MIDVLVCMSTNCTWLISVSLFVVSWCIHLVTLLDDEHHGRESQLRN